MKIIKWDPFREFDRLFSDLTGEERNVEMPSRGAGCWIPRADIVEDVEKTVLSLELPGIDKDAMHIKIENGVLSVAGERKRLHEENEDGYRRVERCFGKFERQFTLPDTIDTDGIAAEYTNGLLTLMLPKKPKALPKQIEIKA